MKRTPTLRHYWFPASHGLGIGVTAPDAGTAWFTAKAAMHRLPPGATLSGQYIEDVDPESLDLGEMPRPTRIAEPGVWFPPGHVRPVQLQVARSPAEAHAGFVHVADDGSARELTGDEAEYLATVFDATDGGRPYVKKRYDSRTPDGRLRGFLPRSEVPPHVTIQPGTSEHA